MTPEKSPYVLALEDDDSIGEMLNAALTEHGYRVKWIQDGKLARNALNLERYDYIVLDINVPNVNGLEVAAYAKSSSLNNKTPLCIASGNLDHKSLDRIDKLKIADVIQKPYSIIALMEKIRTAVASSRDPQKAYDSKIIDIFNDGLMEVFRYYFDIEPQKLSSVIKQRGDSSPGFVSAVISFSANNARGSMSVCINQPFVKKLSEKLFGIGDLELCPEIIADIVGEFSNQVLGAVKRIFSGISVQITLGLPEVIMGNDHIVIHKVTHPVLQTQFENDDITCALEFCMQEVDLSGSNSSDQHKAAGQVVML